jgi:selenocysteine lyase/cysteine desulfurase
MSCTESANSAFPKSPRRKHLFAMTIHRRDLITAFGGFAATAALRPLTSGAALPQSPITFPRKDDFYIEEGYTYLNAAYTHPIPRVSVEAARRAAEARGSLRPTAPPSGRGGGTATTPNPRALFAELINAKPTEIAYVSSTSAGENLVVRSLGLDHRFEGNVVTDGLHFEGAIMHLLELRKRGLDVRVVRPTADARVELSDIERVIDNRTRLVEVSSTAMYNGFQHDLKAVADLAHAHGAYVYADIVHTAGAEPFDVKASGIDFAACSSFKWLMGDFGLGFLYVREDVLPKIQRPVVGYYQPRAIDANYPPNVPAGEYRPIEYEYGELTAASMFEMGTLVGSTEVNLALLASSLAYVKSLGPANIQAHRIPLIRRLQQEVPRLGFTAVTPANSTAANVTFARKGLAESDLPRRLAAAKVNVRLGRDWMRISPSVYNNMTDIDHLLDAIR